MNSLAELGAYVCREGRVFGIDRCLWADTFAQMVLAKTFRLTILLIDMEREKGCLPYRFLYRHFDEDEVEKPASPSSSSLPSASSTASASASASASVAGAGANTRRQSARIAASLSGSGDYGDGEEGDDQSTSGKAGAVLTSWKPAERFIVLKRQGPVGHFQYVERVSDGRSCFYRHELPDAILRLWGL